MNLEIARHIPRRLLSRFSRRGPDTVRRRAARSFARRDNAAGAAALLNLARSGDAEAAFQLADCYERGIGVLHNFVDAVHWFEYAADRGMVKAMSRLGDIYLSGRIVRIGGAPVEACASNEALLGRNRLRPGGLSVLQDFSKALHWNRMAAERGDAEAQARLGSQFAAGLGTARDFDQALGWFRAAAEQGCAAGEFGLGALYAGAMPDVLDSAQAVIWFERAAAQGNSPARMSLALLLIERTESPAELLRAVKLLNEEAEAGQTEAMFRLGELYRSRNFAMRDAVLAETWLRRARTRGHKAAHAALTHLLADQSAPYGGANLTVKE